MFVRPIRDREDGLFGTWLIRDRVRTDCSAFGHSNFEREFSQTKGKARSQPVPSTAAPSTHMIDTKMKSQTSTFQHLHTQRQLTASRNIQHEENQARVESGSTGRSVQWHRPVSSISPTASRQPPPPYPFLA